MQLCNMIINLGDIKRECKLKGAGLNQVFIVLPATSSIAKAINAPVAELTYTDSNARAYLIEFDKDTAQYKSDEKESLAGNLHNHVITGRLRGINLTRDAFRQALQNLRVHVIFTTREGSMRLLPYASMLSDSDSGQKLTDKSAYSFTFKGQTEFPLPYLNDNVLPNSVQMLPDFVFQTRNGGKFRLFVTSQGTLVTVPTSDAATVSSVLLPELVDSAM
jgi:hypothetical protein